MSERAAYSRVYWSVIDDPKFANVYDDDRALATWLRLLLVADQAWPASAHIPTGTHPKALAVLVGAGLVDIGGRRYRIHGLDAERNRRKDAATHPPTGRGPTGPQPGPKRDPEVPGTNDLRRDETRQDETSTTREDGWDQPEIEALQWLARHGCALSETNGLRRKLIGHIERSGVNAVVGAFDRLLEAGVADGDARRFVFGLDDLLFPKPDLKALEREERAEDEAERFNRQVERTQREQARLRGEMA